MNPKLPIIPSTISFSALTNHQYCSWYYKLVDLERLKPWSNSPDTVFGNWIHEAVQDVAQGKSAEEAIKLFHRRWKILCKFYKKFITPEQIKYSQAADQIIQNMPQALKSEFGEYKVLKVEERLSMKAVERFPQRFKGFVDIVLQLSDGKIVIADFKTTDSAFFFQKFQDKYKDYQLSLYKYFYCKTHNVPPESVETYFILLEKNFTSKKPISFLRVTSGKIKIENAVKWLDFVLSAINRQIYIKNRSSCMKYGEKHPCVFYNTDHCPRKK